jgi:hypothetical protein
MSLQSFSASAADEAAHAGPQPPAADRAELYGLCRAARPSGARAGLVVSVDRPAIARRAYRLFRSLGLVVSVRVTGRRYRVHVPDAGPLPGPPSLRAPAAARGFLRGLFLGAGSVSAHHLEIVLPEPGTAELAVVQAARFGVGLHVTVRRGASVAYLKDTGHIADFLRLIGATEASFLIEDARVLHDLKNRVNRLVNADNANIDKAARAAAAQISAIRSLHLGDLPPTLRQVAELRLRHPDLPLRELGALADPPLGRSAVNHRLRALRALGREAGPGRKAFDAGE